MFRPARRSSSVFLIDAQFGVPLSAGKLLFLGVRFWGWNGQEIDHPSHPLIDGGAQGAPMRASRRLNVFEGHRLACMGLTDRAAEEGIVVKNSDFGQVAWIIADGHRLPDIGGQSRMTIA